MSIKKITLYTLAFFLLNSIGIKSSILDYAIAAIYLYLSIILIDKYKYKNSIEYYFPVIMILVWLYGFLIALINNTEIYNIIFNFPGILLLILYYPINTIEFSSKNIFQLFLYSTLVINLYVLTTFLLFGKIDLDLTDLILNRQYYSVSLILQVISVNFLFFTSNGLKNIGLNKNIFIITRINSILSIIVLLMSFSKGFWLSTFVSFIFISFILILHSIKKNKINFKYFKMVIFLPILFILIIYFSPEFYDAILIFFSSDATGNSLRSQQADFLSKEFSLFGAGLGTPLKSGYFRDEYGYAFELSYYNVIHKFGILMSIILLFPFVYSIYYFLKRLYKKGLEFQSIFSISALSFLISAAGNPLLFATINMVIYIIVLTFINKENYEI